MYLLTLIENTTTNGLVTTTGIYDDYDKAVEVLMNFQKEVCMECYINYERTEVMEDWEEESVQDKMFYFRYSTDEDDWYGNIEEVEINTTITI